MKTTIKMFVILTVGAVSLRVDQCGWPAVAATKATKAAATSTLVSPWAVPTTAAATMAAATMATDNNGGYNTCQTNNGYNGQVFGQAFEPFHSTYICLPGDSFYTVSLKEYGTSANASSTLPSSTTAAERRLGSRTAADAARRSAPTAS